MSNFDWMNEAIYEPRAQTFQPQREPPRFARVFVSLAIIALGVGALVGLAWG